MKKEQEKEKSIPNMSDPPKKAVPVKRKKKKLLHTPSQIIRICMIWTYVLVIYLLTMPFVTTTLYIKDDLSIGTDVSSASMTYATQEEINKAADELEAAINALVPSGEKKEEYQGNVALSSASFDWKYYIANGVKYDRIASLIEKSKSLDRIAYTEKSVEAVNTATLRAQQKLCAMVTVSQSAFQIALGGMVNDVPAEQLRGVIFSGILIYTMILLPAVGFFICTFNKKGHLKNVYNIICSLTCLCIILFGIYPSIGLGAVLTVFAYILLMCLTGGSIYAKQQEDYIVKHPELEAEFTEKHPHFVKALINSKSVNLNAALEKEQRIEEAQKKTGTKKKKK